MGTSNYVDKTFSDDGLLSKIIPNYAVRPQQVELASTIQKCIEEGTPLIAEAPTGVGKSLGALVPSFEHIKRTDEPVIVVTSSIVLQDQYIKKDIPLLEELYGFQVNAVSIKGRNNYVCKKKLRDAVKGKASYSSSTYAEEHKTVVEWASVTESGDKAELDFVPKYPVWSNMACIDNEECTGKGCPLYNQCHYYRERNKVQTSKLVVCNYHYFFSSLQTEANMLPYGARVVIMDEGHEINAIARDFQERKYSTNSLKNQFSSFAEVLKQVDFTDFADSASRLFYNMELDQVNGTMTDLFVGLKHAYKQVVNEHYTRDFWMLERPVRTRLQKYAVGHKDALKQAIDVAQEYLERYGFDMESIPYFMEDYGETVTEWFIAVDRLLSALYQKHQLIDYVFCFDEEQVDGDDIFWLQPTKDSVSVHCKPTTGAGLTEGLFGGRLTPIIMSATLSANKSFDHLRADLGIQEAKHIKELIVNSPFNLDDNLLWYLPSDTPAGNDKDHMDFVLKHMKQVIDTVDGRTLCLFTSKKNMLLADAYFKKSLPSHIQVVSQDDMPKQKIVEFMKSHDNVVVIGTKSFFTGIDIQGQHLSAVLLDKFPFPMIGDPINDYLSSLPRGFHKYALPEAIISMKQAFGRLNRTTTDRGVVALFDGRLATARYKNKIFNSFDFKIQATKDWNRVVEYVEEINQNQGAV